MYNQMSFCQFWRYDHYSYIPRDFDSQLTNNWGVKTTVKISRDITVGVCKVGRKCLKVTIKVFCMNKIIVPCIKFAQKYVWVTFLSILRKIPKIKWRNFFSNIADFLGSSFAQNLKATLSFSQIPCSTSWRCDMLHLAAKTSFLWLF